MPAAHTLLVTGFEPFDERAVNSSQAVLNHLPRTIAGMAVETVVLPVAWRRSSLVLHEVVRKTRPVLAVGLGMTRGAEIALERVAVNFRGADRIDVDGQAPPSERIVKDGPLAYRSDLPLESILARLVRLGVRARISGSAGDYLCNQLFYELLAARTSGVPNGAGFIHLPPLEGDNAADLVRLTEAVHAALDEACTVASLRT